MIITRTPFRISLFGGGTDYPAWYRENGGAVLAGSINKYCYLSCRRFPPFFEVKYRVVYNRIELVNTIDEIEHPSVRTCIKSYGPDDTGLEIVHNADLPARSGLGSSSAFTVGLLHALHGLAGRLVGRPQLAEQAIHLEQEVMCENVGSQDQIAVALGGLNVISFAGDGWRAQPLPLPRLRREELEAHLMLFFTGISRTASDVAAHQIRNLSRRAVELRAMQAMVDHGIEILTGNGDITDFGQLLDESWQLKRRLSEYISTDLIDELYARARANGALGGKLLGAGGGGFLLLFARPADQPVIRAALAGYLYVPFRFENAGSQIILYNPA